MTKTDLYYFLKENEVKQEWDDEKLVAWVPLKVFEGFYTLVEKKVMPVVVVDGLVWVNLTVICEENFISPEYLFSRPINEKPFINVNKTISKHTSKDLIAFLKELDKIGASPAPKKVECSASLRWLITWSGFETFLENYSHVKQLIEVELIERLKNNTHK
jgi:hypothetical protein